MVDSGVGMTSGVAVGSEGHSRGRWKDSRRRSRLQGNSRDNRRRWSRPRNGRSHVIRELCRCGNGCLSCFIGAG